jgi:hypothetical protein
MHSTSAKTVLLSCRVQEVLCTTRSIAWLLETFAERDVDVVLDIPSNGFVSNARHLGIAWKPFAIDSALAIGNDIQTNFGTCTDESKIEHWKL